jgi:hypothetical protein
MPDRETLLRFIAENPDRATKRDIAKAFSLKGDARIDLKALLKELESEGLIERRRKQLARPGSLPPVALLDITTRDSDGGLIARPAEWLEESGVPPAVAIRQSAPAVRGPALAASDGDGLARDEGTWFAGTSPEPPSAWSGGRRPLLAGSISTRSPSLASPVSLSSTVNSSPRRSIGMMRPAPPGISRNTPRPALRRRSITFITRAV